VLNVGVMCTIDLFPVPECVYESRSTIQTSPQSSCTNQDTGSGYEQSRYSLTYFPVHPYKSLDVDEVRASVAPFQIPRRQPMLRHLLHSEFPDDAVFRIGNHLITESSKLTPALVGEKCVEPTLVDYKGRKALVFVFGVRCFDKKYH
jgi:hypothetical protein